MVLQAEAGRKTDERDERIRRFQGALRIAGTTMEKWAEEKGVSYGHLRFVLRGERESPRLNEEIARFIAAHIGAA